MKAKKVKQYQKVMNQYKLEFGFREPYQILVELEALAHGLKMRMDIKQVLCDMLDGSIKLMITKCMISSMRSKGDDYLGAVVASKRLVNRRCTHKTPIEGKQCFLEVIGKENTHRYGIISMDKTLNLELQSVPGVPTFYFHNDQIGLYPVSTKTKDIINKTTQAKLGPSSTELELLNRIVGTKSAVVPVIKDNRKPKRKKIKGPNPLSVKKKAKIQPTQNNNEKIKKDENKKEEKINEVKENDDVVTEKESGEVEHKKKRTRSKKTKPVNIDTPNNQSDIIQIETNQVSTDTKVEINQSSNVTLVSNSIKPKRTKKRGKKIKSNLTNKDDEDNE